MAGNDGRQSSNNRGGRGQTRHFSREGKQRLVEGARRGGQNSHRSDADNDRNGGSGRSNNDDMNVGNQRAIDMLSPQAQDQIRNELRDEMYDEVREDVLNEVHQKLDEIGQERGDENNDDRNRGSHDD